MSPASRLVALGLALASFDAAGTEHVSGPECSTDVCVLNIAPQNPIVAPCAGDSLLVAYSKSSGATLIQCNSPTEVQDNKTFVFDRDDSRARRYEFSGGRFIRPDYLTKAKANGIPDRFGSVPLCAAKGRYTPGPAEFLIAEKRPNDSENAPYCYRMYYVIRRGGTLRIHADDGHEVSPLSEAAAGKWAKIKEQLSPYIGRYAKSSLGATRTASILPDKAELFQHPDSAAMTKMYLVKGDQVEIIDDSKIAEGWLLVRYVTKVGRAIERWIRARDVRQK